MTKKLNLDQSNGMKVIAKVVGKYEDTPVVDNTPAVEETKKPKRGRPKANRELKKRMTLSLFPSDYAELQRIADEKRTSASAIVQDLIVNYIIEYKENTR